MALASYLAVLPSNSVQSGTCVHCAGTVTGRQERSFAVKPRRGGALAAWEHAGLSPPEGGLVASWARQAAWTARQEAGFLPSSRISPGTRRLCNYLQKTALQTGQSESAPTVWPRRFWWRREGGREESNVRWASVRQCSVPSIIYFMF